MVLNVAATEQPGHHLRWRFSDAVDWEPKLSLRMGWKVANAYLQGKESLAIAIARGRVHARGDTRCALLYVPPSPRRRALPAAGPQGVPPPPRLKPGALGPTPMGFYRAPSGRLD